MSATSELWARAIEAMECYGIDNLDEMSAFIGWDNDRWAAWENGDHAPFAVVAERILDAIAEQLPDLTTREQKRHTHELQRIAQLQQILEATP